MCSQVNQSFARCHREERCVTGAVAAAHEWRSADHIERFPLCGGTPGSTAKRAGMMRFLLVIMAALALLVGLVPGASAGDEWCEVDPVVVITTPGGSVVPVFVNIRAQGLEHLAALELSQISYTTQSTDGGTATEVQMTVLVPGDQFSDRYPVQVVVTTGPARTGTTLASAKGYSEQDLQLKFTLYVA
jgi:hypothetical protein